MRQQTNSGGTDLLYAPGEGIFSLAAPMMSRQGWSVFPQERAGTRRPGRAGGEFIAWGRLCETRPTAEELALWCADCPQLNVAVAFGAASGDTFALDIDALDPDLSRELRALAFDMLGVTPFVRIGRAPKVALIYRHPPGDVPRNISRKFVTPGTDKAGEDGLEVLARGKPLTLHGLHHITGRYFHWPESNPLTSPPTDAPLVTSADVTRYLEEVSRRRPFFRGSEMAGGLSLSAEDWGDAGGLKVPVVRDPEGYPTDDEGRVCDMRERYLTGLVFHVVTANRNELIRAHSDGVESLRAFIGRMSRAVTDLFRETAVVDGKWRGKLDNDTFHKVSHLAQKVAASPDDYASPMRGGGKARTFTVAASSPRNRAKGADAPQPVSRPVDPELAWMRANPRVPVRGWHDPAQDGHPGRAVREDRDIIAAMVGDGIEAALDIFLAEANDPKANAGLHILDAPTGGGKTSRTLRRLAADPRTYASGLPPYVMLLPTYSNIEELRLRAQVLDLDGGLPDAELAQAARALGLLGEGDVTARVAELRRDALNCPEVARLAGAHGTGFRTAVYSGKIKAGCVFPEKVELAMSAGVGASSFCRATIRDARGDSVEEVCPHYTTCPAIRQREEATRAHVVFMPHSFLALKVPEELENVRGVIADERVHHLFLHVAELRLATLASPRRPPRLTPIEREEGMDAQEILADRNSACRTVVAAMGRGECPALVLLESGNDMLAARPRGLVLAEQCLRVCGDGVKRDGSLSPSTSFEELRAYCTRPVGREIREELQFWRIVTERIQQLLMDRDLSPIAAAERAEAELASLPEDAPVTERRRLSLRVERLRRYGGNRAKGTRDARIQSVEDGEGESVVQKVRLSWRTKPNWEGVPTLLLDASAAPDVAAKIWGIARDRVTVHRPVGDDFGGILNVKVVAVTSATFSNTYVAGRPDSQAEERLRAASRLSRVRDAVSAVCAVHGDGRVVAGASILVREAVSESWTPPRNLDWCHFGAMRGLDVFKFHAAAISVGRMELPVRTIDGLVAALAYDDPDPEEPFDVRGDGRDPDDPAISRRPPMVPRELRMRDGSTAWVEVPCYPGRWAALMQRQYREEELLQFVGRLRPVYREGRPPVWYALTSVIPEGLVVDDVLDIEDLLGGVPCGPAMWDAARRLGGILEPKLMATRCTDAFRDTADAAAMLRAAGFDATLGIMTPGSNNRAWAAWSIWEWRAGRGEARGFLLAAGGVGVTEIADALTRTVFRPVLTRVRAATDAGSGFLAMAAARPPDTVETRLGTPPERGVAEEALLDAAGLAALVRGRHDVTSGMVETHVAGVRAALTVRDFLSEVALGRAWNRRVNPVKSPAPDVPLREGDESPSWDALGATAEAA